MNDRDRKDLQNLDRDNLLVFGRFDVHLLPQLGHIQFFAENEHIIKNFGFSEVLAHAITPPLERAAHRKRQRFPW